MPSRLLAALTRLESLFVGSDGLQYCLTEKVPGVVMTKPWKAAAVVPVQHLVHLNYGNRESW